MERKHMTTHEKHRIQVIVCDNETQIKANHDTILSLLKPNNSFVWEIARNFVHWYSSLLLEIFQTCSMVNGHMTDEASDLNQQGLNNNT